MNYQQPYNTRLGQQLEETKECSVRVIGSGSAQLYKNRDLETQRIRDSSHQLDFIIESSPQQLCSTVPTKNNTFFHKVIGMDKVYILQQMAPNDTIVFIGDQKESDKILQAELSAAAHNQYIRDVAVEISNNLAKEVRLNECRTRKLAHYNAIATAQFNGWQAASYLDLPLCVKLTAIGQSVAALQCAPQTVNFTTVITRCGPQPRYKDNTINVEGWELTKFTECYWHSSFVNFNGHAYSYRNQTWQKVTTSLIVQGHQHIKTASFQADNSLGNILKSHPTFKSNPLSINVAIADILATVQEHHANDFTSETQINSVLIKDITHTSFLSKFSRWLQSFGIISVCGVGITIAVRFCGIGSIIARYLPFLSIFNFLRPSTTSSPDIELGQRPTVSNSHPQPSPITIVTSAIPDASRHPHPKKQRNHRQPSDQNTSKL